MKRWVQHTMPVFVCFESSDTVEQEKITRVIVADDEPEDVHLARDAFGEFGLYDEDFDRVYNDREQAHVLAMTEARRYWPGRSDWQRSSDPRREPEYYGEVLDEEEGVACRLGLTWFVLVLNVSTTGTAAWINSGDLVVFFVGSVVPFSSAPRWPTLTACGGCAARERCETDVSCSWSEHIHTAVGVMSRTRPTQSVFFNDTRTT